MTPSALKLVTAEQTLAVNEEEKQGVPAFPSHMSHHRSKPVPAGKTLAVDEEEDQGSQHPRDICHTVD